MSGLSAKSNAAMGLGPAATGAVIGTAVGPCCCGGGGDAADDIGTEMGVVSSIVTPAAAVGATAPSLSTRPGIGSPGFHPAGIGGRVRSIPAKLRDAAAVGACFGSAVPAGGRAGFVVAFFSAE